MFWVTLTVGIFIGFFIGVLAMSVLQIAREGR